MKNVLLLIGLLLSLNSFSQKIEESKFNAKDSTHTFLTSTEVVGNRIVPVSGDIKLLQACAVYSKSLRSNNTVLSNTVFEPLLSFFFVPDRVASMIGGVSAVKVKFTDGEVVEHKYEGSNKLVGTNQQAAIYFTVFTTDKLFTTPIQSIKVSLSTADVEFEIIDKRRDIIKNSLQLLQQQTEYLR